MHSLGGNPHSVEFHNRVRGVIQEHALEQTTEGRARHLLIQAVEEAALTQKIIAAKGRPHSQAAYDLLDQRLARG